MPRTAAAADGARTSVLFIQGGGEGVHDHWDGKLVESLRQHLGAAYDIRYPRMPNEGDPQFDSWKREILAQLATLEPGAIVIGHSVGGTILIHTLAAERMGRSLGAICLIAAPFIGDGGWTAEEMPSSADLGRRLPGGVPILLFHGTEDAIVPPSHARLYAQAIPAARLRHLPQRDHQLHNDLSEVAADLRELAQRGAWHRPADE